MKIAFLVHSLYSLGGTIRTTLNTATALLEWGHDVELISVFRRRTRPVFGLDPRFTVTSLVDVRTDAQPDPLTSAEEALAQRPSKVFPATETRFHQYNRLVDARVAKALRDTNAEVIVGTRPGLNVYLAAFAPRTAVRVGQEHLSLDHHGKRLTRRLYKTYRELDALVTVSATDAQQYRRGMPKVADKVSYTANSVPSTSLPPAEGDSKLIVAAGRLEPVKRFDVLLHAFTRIRERHPDWRLRVYGHGKQAPELRELIIELGLNDSVMIMGAHAPLDAELVKGSIVAVTSDFEAFGLTIVEAMNCGLPVVATDCPHGPGEIINADTDGLLTQPGDAEAFADAVCTLIEDPRARERMAKAARVAAERYSPEHVGREYEELFTKLARAKRLELTPPKATTTHAEARVSASARSESFEHVVLALPEGEAAVKRRGLVHKLPDRGPGDELTLDSQFLGELSQGIWTIIVDGSKVPADRIDSRRLLQRPTSPPSTVAVPFSRDGMLAVRVWRSPVYPEVDTVTWNDAEMMATGDFVGQPHDPSEAFLVSRDEPTLTHSASIAVDGQRFTITVDARPLTEHDTDGTRLWDVHITDGQRELVVGKVLDDLAQRKNPHRLPRWWSKAGRRVQPYFNVDNQLSLKISEGPDSDD